ncbi:group II intron maturase-specific domain-containing protein (plasmid) [Rhizobium sp. T1473]|uniref:group II intron maturase-specific domain-containing protein n=1 Tax=Rhizobium sp. T1473 TaxID=555321 RepID=UPI0021E5FB24|nr:hypothetical protein [Rhizobium sp. T1473]
MPREKHKRHIARLINPLLRGWISYYGRYAPTGLQPILRYVNKTVVAWARRKFSALAGVKFGQVCSYNGSSSSAPISLCTGNSV